MTSGIRRVDPADEDIMRATYDVWRAAYLDGDPDNPVPTFPEILAGARAPQRSSNHEFYVLRHDGGSAVGCYWLDLPTKDNLDLVELDLAVLPAAQHRGLGRLLLQHALARVAELGRHQVIAGINEPASGSENRSMTFATAAGARRSLGEVRRTLDLETLDHARLAQLRAGAEEHASGYPLVSWTGPCPDELVDDYAALVARMSTDAPMGDLDIEPENWDAARIRERDDVVARQGRTMLATAARHGEGGPLVAFTDLATTRYDPTNAFQWDTLVHRDHRGHRLGLLVKLANLQRLCDEAPEVRRLHTWNADTNTFMVAVNEAMGFRVARQESAWRLDLPRADDGTSGDGDG